MTPERRSHLIHLISYFAPPCGGVGAGAGAVGAAGVAGFGEVEPEPVVLGAVPVAVGDEPVLAVFGLLFQPAMIRKPISSRTATPAIQPHIPPAALSSRRSTGSLNRGSLYRGSVKRGSVMTSSFHSDANRVEWRKPAGHARGSFNKRVRLEPGLRPPSQRGAMRPTVQRRSRRGIPADLSPGTKTLRSDRCHK